MALTASQLAVALGGSDPPSAATLAVATRLLSVTVELVNTYASAAPQSIRDEAAIRTAAYLNSSTAGAALRSLKVGDALQFEFRAAGSALRLSGSSALLSPWRSRTTGRCEAAE